MPQGIGRWAGAAERIAIRHVLRPRSQRSPARSATPRERAGGMDERFDLYRGGECVRRGASLREAAELLNIDVLDLALTVLQYRRCVVGEFSAVPTEDLTASI